MKKTILFCSFMLSLFAGLNAQEIPPAPEGKAVVYFVRTSSLGFAINFSYLDSAKLIGRFNGPKYIRYECEPGKHLLWARSENRDYIEADLEPGKIYLIEAVPQMGALKAGVSLSQIDPGNEKAMAKVLKLMAKKPSESFTPEQLAADTKDLEDAIAKGLAKYAEEKAKGGGKITVLDPAKNYLKP